MDNNKIDLYLNSNEQNGCHSAVGYAKTTGNTGVMLTTSGPGLTNCITPILDATHDSTPLVVISAQVALCNLNTQSFQEAPSVEITTPVTKFSHLVTDINDLKNIINLGFKVANNKKKGAVHIDIPKCILTAIHLSGMDHTIIKYYRL